MSSPRYVQNLLIVMCRKNETSNRANNIEGVYVVVPHVSFYEDLCNFFAKLKIEVLTLSFNPFLINAIKSGQINYIEIFLEKDQVFEKSAQPVVYTDISRKQHIEAAFSGHCRVKNLKNWYLLTRNDLDSIDLLDEDNLNTIEQLLTESESLSENLAKVRISLSHCPILSGMHLREEQMKAFYVRTYSGEKVIKMLEKRGLRLIEKDAQDAELVFGAVDLDRPDLLESLLKWGAGVFYRRSASIVQDSLIRAENESSIRSYEFLTKLDDSCSQKINPSVLTELSSNLLPRGIASFHDVLNSYGLDLNFIFDPKFRSKLRFWQISGLGNNVTDMTCHHVAAVKAANLNVNQSFTQNLQSYLRDENVRGEFYQRLEFPSPDNLLQEVASMKKRMIGESRVSHYDFLNADRAKTVHFLRDERCLNALKERYSREGMLFIYFPNYSDMIQWKFRKALFRRKLMKKGIKMFNFLFKGCPGLPDEIIEKMFDYLSNLDLLVFVNICKLPDPDS